MKTLQRYITESTNPNIKFRIWDGPGNQVTKLKDNNYSKIEYKYKDYEKGIGISFLLGLQDDEWCLYAGPIGKSSYDKFPLQELHTKKFDDALTKSVPYIEGYIDKVNQNPRRHVMYYTFKQA